MPASAKDTRIEFEGANRKVLNASRSATTSRELVPRFIHSTLPPTGIVTDTGESAESVMATGAASRDCAPPAEAMSTRASTAPATIASNTNHLERLTLRIIVFSVRLADAMKINILLILGVVGVLGSSRIDCCCGAQATKNRSALFSDTVFIIEVSAALRRFRKARAQKEKAGRERGMVLVHRGTFGRMHGPLSEVLNDEADRP
jgi:hypothetical protein